MSVSSVWVLYFYFQDLCKKVYFIICKKKILKGSETFKQ